MVPHLRRAALLITVTATSAHAWDAFFRISFEVTSRGTVGSTESSSNASSRSQGSSRQDPVNQSSYNPQCHIDADCALSQYCEQGRCVQPVAARPQPQPRPMPGCADDSQCAMGYACFEGRCVERMQPQPQPQPEAPYLQAPQCTSDQHCMQGQSCVRGTCMSPPPFPPPSSSLERRGTEVFVRERAAQLRQDLALGEGPVLASLAVEHKVTVRKLGLILRANRVELRELMGDGADTSWPARFLDRVDQLLAPRIAASEERDAARGPG